MLVYIFACDSVYGGLHGMNEEDVVEVPNLSVAHRIGQNMSEDVIYSYGEFDDEELENTGELQEWRVYKIRDEFSLDDVVAELGKHDEEVMVKIFCYPEELDYCD